MSTSPDETPLFTELTAKALLDTVFPRDLDAAIDEQLAAYPATLIDCPACGGRGEIPLNPRRNEWGVWDEDGLRECHICSGQGELAADVAAEYRAYRAEMDEE